MQSVAATDALSSSTVVLAFWGSNRKGGLEISQNLTLPNPLPLVFLSFPGGQGVRGRGL